jgi:D-glycero-D-manno-heptose 1,7-bisphosphate phosphatase
VALPGVAPDPAANSDEVVGRGLRRAVFLDRDGVINRAIVREGKPYAPETVEQLEILPGVEEALDRLRKAGFLNIVVTNQPDVGAGRVSRDAVVAMHERLLKELPIDALKVCYHVAEDDCECRKPKPGMIVEAAREHDVNLEASFLVGDRWRDVAAGQRAGCKCLFIDYGYEERRPHPPYLAVNSLTQATTHILQSDGP